MHTYLHVTFSVLIFTVRDWWTGVAWAGHKIWDSRCYRCCVQQSCRICYFRSFLFLMHASLSLCLHFISASTSACCRSRLTAMTFVNFLFTCLRNCALDNIDRILSLKQTHACTVVQSMRNSTGCLRLNSYSLLVCVSELTPLSCVIIQHHHCVYYLSWHTQRKHMHGAININGINRVTCAQDIIHACKIIWKEVKKEILCKFMSMSL